MVFSYQAGVNRAGQIIGNCDIDQSFGLVLVVAGHQAGFPAPEYAGPLIIGGFQFYSGWRFFI